MDQRGGGGGVDQTSMVSSISHGGEGTSNRPGQVVQRPILTLTRGLFESIFLDNFLYSF